MTERWARIAYWLLLLSPGWLPIFAPYLPFQDWGLRLGATGAYLHFDEPAARLGETLIRRPGLSPNDIFDRGAVLLSFVLPPLWALRVMLALTLGAFGPALRSLCLAAGSDPRWALAALPLAFGRHLFCGFAPQAMALVFFALALAAQLRITDRARKRDVAVLAASLIVCAFAHTFIYLAAAGLIALWIVCDLAQRNLRAAGLGAAGLVLGVLGWLPLQSSLDRGGAAEPTVFAALSSAFLAADRSGLAKEFWEWLFASYRYRVLDDGLQSLWLLSLVALLAFAAFQRHLARRARRVLLAAAVTTLMFVLLPTNVGPPLNWWGGNLRLPVLVGMLAAASLGTFRPWLSLPLLVPALAFVLFVLFDVREFSSREMNGFAQVIDAIPPGKKLSGLYFTPPELREYPGEPHGYAAAHYLLEKGGYVSENGFELKLAPFLRKVSPPTSPWGSIHGFSYPHHAPFFDAFLVRIDPSRPEAPLGAALAAGEVELVLAAGNWRYYEKKRR